MIYPKEESSNINNRLNIHKPWHAVYVRSRHEKSVHKMFQAKGINSSLPLKIVYHRWNDRKQKIAVPLFRSYVFVNIDIQSQRLDVLQTSGVVKFITFRGKIAAIQEVQMYWLNRILITSNIEQELEFPVGVDVEVVYGPFKGLCGKVKQKHSETRLVVWFDAIMQGVSVDIDPMYLKGRK